MLRRLFLFALAMAFIAPAWAQLPANKRDRVGLNDEVFMEMAIDAANTAIEQGRGPSGAVLILNDAWRSTGLPDADTPAELAAAAKARRPDLKGCSIYTLNEPAAAVVVELSSRGLKAIYFANSAADVIAAGILTPDDYDYSALDVDPDIKLAPLQQVAMPATLDIIKSWSNRK